jgi:hypothetical protein
MKIKVDGLGGWSDLMEIIFQKIRFAIISKRKHEENNFSFDVFHL